MLGTDPAIYREFSKFTTEQRAFLRALANTGITGPQSANEIPKLAAATYGVRFPEKSLPKLVLNALVSAGYINAAKTTEGRGAKPFMVAPTGKVTGDLIEPLFDQLKDQTDPKLVELLRKPIAEVRAELHSDHIDNFAIDNGAAIPPNLIALPNTESNGAYQRYCEGHGLTPHPARYPAELPEYFIRMLTDRGDLVLDPFGGSCVTGEVSQRLGRRWLCVELLEDYLKGAVGRFTPNGAATVKNPAKAKPQEGYYRMPRPGLLWNGTDGDLLPADGGKQRPASVKTARKLAKPMAGADNQATLSYPIAAAPRKD